MLKFMTYGGKTKVLQQSDPVPDGRQPGQSVCGFNVKSY